MTEVRMPKTGNKICTACGEIFSSALQCCPVCGCPKDRFTISGMGFPSALERSWELTGVRQGSGGRVNLRIRKKKTGREAMACRLAPDETILENAIRSRKAAAGGALPQVYEIVEDPEGSIVLFEFIPGQTLQEMAEQTWPLDGRFLKQTSEFLERSFWELANSTGYTGEPDLCTVGVADGVLRLMDFGGKCVEEDLRVLAGEWAGMPLMYAQDLPPALQTGSGGESEENFFASTRFKWILIGILSVILLLQIIYIAGHLSLL